MIRNCFSLLTTNIEPNLLVNAEIGGHSLYLGYRGESQHRIPLGHGTAEFAPEVLPNGEIECAQARIGARGEKWLARPQVQPASILLLVKATNLRFGFPRILSDSRYWPGGERIGGPWAQCYASNSPNKEQLFELVPGERMFAIDCDGAVASITHIGRTLRFVAGNVSEFASYLEAYVIRKLWRDAGPADAGNIYRNAQWGIRTIEGFGMQTPAIREAWAARRAEFGTAASGMELR